MDFSELLKKALPWIGAAATGNVPALVSLAAKQVSDVIGAEVPANQEAIAQAVANATPEQMAAFNEKEAAFRERMQAMGFQNAQELARIGLEETKTFVADTNAARQAHAGNAGVFWLGIAVLLTFAGTVGACLYGAFQLLAGGITLRDASVVAGVAGFIGTVVGYVAAMGQQVTAYFFGSSKGSQDKTNAMAEAVRGLGGGHPR